MNQIADAYIAACQLDIDAVKPGNVNRHAPGHGMTAHDFEISAIVSAAGLTRSGSNVGTRIFEAIVATKAAVGQNTNLGIVLLCAPLAAAAESGEPLEDALRNVIKELSIEDARLGFLAIGAANPGGLGFADQHDVRAAATTTLRDAMLAAAARDLIARQYSSDYADVFGTGLNKWREARQRSEDPRDAATDIYLTLLQSQEDTHIARKFGLKVAQALRSEAQARIKALSVSHGERRNALLQWDAELKMRGLNPGACADVTVAALFAALLMERPSNILRPIRKSG